MLVLSRKKGETLIIGDEIQVTVLDIKGDQVRIGIAAPREVSILRKEILTAVKEENLTALNINESDLRNIGEIIRKTEE